MNQYCRLRISSLVLALSMLGAAFAQPPATESGFVYVEDDVRIFYQRFGSGTPKVFIPNRQEVILSFAPLLNFHDVVTWDPRGRGLSDRPDDLSRYGFEVEFADAEALRRHFGSEDITYVGLSLWANVGLLYAASYPESVARVVALAPMEIATELYTPPDRVVEHDVSAFVAQYEAMERDGRNVTEAHEYCRIGQIAFWADAYIDMKNMAAFMAANQCQYANEAGDMIGPVIFEGIFGKLGEWDWREDMTRVAAPVLLLFGDHEHAIAGVEAYADHLPDVGWLMVENAAHHVHNDRPDVVIPMMDVFFRGQWPEGLNR